MEAEYTNCTKKYFECVEKNGWNEEKCSRIAEKCANILKPYKLKPAYKRTIKEKFERFVQFFKNL